MSQKQRYLIRRQYVKYLLNIKSHKNAPFKTDHHVHVNQGWGHKQQVYILVAEVNILLRLSRMQLLK